MGVSVAITRLAHGQGLPLPEYRTPGSAGMDLFAAIADDAALAIEPGRWALVPTGLALHLPEGYEGQIRPRSGLALRHGVTVLNAPGTIDADYRGEVGVVLINHAASAFTVTRGMRIAQLVVAPIARVRLEEQDQLAASSRGAKGFGSTGV